MNLYEILDLKPSCNILDILNSFKNKCLNNPIYTFYYTNALSILIDKNKRLLYDASLLKIDILKLQRLLDIYLKTDDVDEYELIPIIDWLNSFKDFFYDTKYFVTNENYHKLIESWYNTFENILETIKEQYIHSFYLA